MGGGGKGGADIDYTQSPQQQQMAQMLMPTLQNLFGGGWQAPAAQQPTRDWYSGLSPDVLGGLQQPYMEAQKQGMELLGGSAGTARAGATGAAGAMTGDIMSQMAMQVPMQAWQMGQPGRMAEYQANLMPYQAATSMMGGTYPEAVVDQGGGGFGGALGGALGGGALGSMLGLGATAAGPGVAAAAMSPWMWPLIGGGALLGGK